MLSKKNSINTNSLDQVVEDLFDLAGTDPDVRKNVQGAIQQRLQNLHIIESSGIKKNTLQDYLQAVLHPLWPVLLFANANRSSRVNLNKPLTKHEYRRECLRRSPALHDDLLRFHQKFPPLFVKANRGVPFSKFPDWLKTICTPRNGRLLLGSPKTLRDLDQLLGMGTELVVLPRGWRILHPYHGNEYFNTIGVNSLDWENHRLTFKQKWPEAAGEWIDSGRLKDLACPWLLLPSFTALKGGESGTMTGSIDPKEWSSTLAVAGRSAKMMIPIYRDTVADDIDWETVKKWKAVVYGPTIPRTREKLLARRLTAYDLYQEFRLFSRLAKVLKIPPKTARDEYLRAHKDIHGTFPRGTKKTRRTSGINPETHITNCSRCNRSDSTDTFCSTGKALMAEVERTDRFLVPYNDQLSYTSLTGGGRRKAPKPLSDSFPEED